MSEELQNPTSLHKDDRLFRGDLKDWRNNACLYCYEGHERAYILGYQLGAQLLAQHVIAKSCDQDVLVYPLIFMYRHHIELILKNILRQAVEILERQLTAEEKKHLKQHDLSCLWSDCLKALGEAIGTTEWGPISPVEIDIVSSCIRQLNDVDSGSFNFRYKYSKTGKLSIRENLTHINLRYFAERLEQLSSSLSGLHLAVTELQASKFDMESDWPSSADVY